MILKEKWPTDLHHEHYSVESNHDHDGVLKWWRDHKLPQAVLKGLLVLWHIAGQRFGIDSKVNAGSLRRETAKEELITNKDTHNYCFPSKG